MNKKYVVAVIGATGNVGREVLNSLSSRNFPVKEVIAAASSNSVGREVSFGDSTLKVMQMSELYFNKIDIAFFCAGSVVSAKYAQEAVKNRCTVIDKSSFYRLDQKVPLVVPEANLKPEVFSEQIAFNLFPHVGDFREDGYSEEEYKIEEELKKIIGEQVNPTVTCVRVPVFVSHSMSVNVEFEKNINAQEAEEILEDADGVITYNIENEMKYATPIDVVENDEVFISRIRDDKSRKNSLNLWICSDNLRKGAALNAVQIAEKIIT